MRRITLTEFDLKNEHVNLYNPREAADYCQVSVPTLNDWRLNKYVDPAGIIEAGRGYLYTECALIGALQAKNYDRRNLNVEVLGDGE